jgi:hypothetical protein
MSAIFKENPRPEVRNSPGIPHYPNEYVFRLSPR